MIKDPYQDYVNSSAYRPDIEADRIKFWIEQLNEQEHYQHTWKREQDLYKKIDDPNYIRNPGQIDLSKENPDLYKSIQELRQLQALYSPQLRESLDPNRYDARVREMQDRSGTAIENRYAQMGLAGSSAALGAEAESGRQIGLSMHDRQFSEQLQALQAELNMNQLVQRGVLSGQQLFNTYQMQNVAKDMNLSNINMGLMGLENQRRGQDLQVESNKEAADAANEAAIWGAIGSIGGTILGAAVGGPVGAVAGGAIGRGASSAATSQAAPSYSPPQSYTTDYNYAPYSNTGYTNYANYGYAEGYYG